MNFSERVLEYLRLFRFHAVSMETTIILIGALVMGQRDIWKLFIVFLIGLFGHITGYVLNDYADLEIDKKSIELKEKPLVSGRIPKSYALIAAMLSAVITYALTIYYFPYPWTISLLVLATLLTIIYDFYGKKIPGSDFIVAGSIAVFCLFGASTVSSSFTSLIYLVCLVFFFDVVFINVVEGGLKDVDHDHFLRSKTLATVTGVRVEKNKLIITKKFLSFAYAFRGIHVFFIILLGFDPMLNIWLSDKYAIQIIAVIFIVMLLFGSYKFLHLKIFDRSKMKKLYGGVNAASGILLIVLLYPILGFTVALFLLLYPLMWYSAFNVLLYGKPLEPQV